MPSFFRIHAADLASQILAKLPFWSCAERLGVENVINQVQERCSKKAKYIYMHVSTANGGQVRNSNK